MVNFVIYGSFLLEGDRFEGMNLDIVESNQWSTLTSGKELVGIFLSILEVCFLVQPVFPVRSFNTFRG